MKKLLFSLSCVLLASGLSISQQLLEGFESGTFTPTGWNESHTGVDALDQSMTRVNNGTYSALFDDANSVDTSILTTDTINSLTASSQLTFWQNQNWDTYYVYHAIWISVNGAPAIELANLGAGTEDVWEEITVNLSAYAGAKIALSFVYVGDFADEWFIDDIMVDVIPTCPIPSGIMLVNTFTDSASFTWTENGTATNWLIDAGVVGFTPGIGTLVSNDTAGIGGLASSTNHEFYLRSYCGVGDTSSWVGPFNFATTCATFTAPFNEAFSTPTLPLCWTEAGATPWEYGSDNGTVPSGFAAYGAENVTDHSLGGGGTFIGIDGSDNGSNDTSMLLTPMIDVSGLTTPAISYAIFSNNIDDTARNTFYAEFWDGAAWNGLDTVNDNLGPAWVNRVFDISGYTITGDIQIRFTVIGDTLGSTYFNDILIDDVTVNELPSCAAPSLLVIDSISNNFANLNWMEMGTATDWIVEYGMTGFTLGTGTNSGVTTTKPYPATGLVANTSYDFYVSAFCAVGDTSNWVGPFTFTTSCDPIVGDSASDPIIVSSTNYIDSGSNASCFTDQIGESSADVWYRYITDKCSDSLTVSLCGSSFDTYLWIYEADGTTLVNDSDDECGAQSELIIEDGSAYNGGDTLLIVVEGFGSNAGDYILEVNEVINMINLTVNVATDTAIAADTSAISYQWIDCDNGDTAITGATQYWFKPSVSGNYAVIINNGNCSDTSSCVSIATTGISQNDIVNFSVYPNPNNGEFTVKLNNNNLMNIEVVNTVGQVVYRSTINNSLANINLQSVAKGSYIIRVFNDNVSSIEKLIIK